MGGFSFVVGPFVLLLLRQIDNDPFQWMMFLSFGHLARISGLILVGCQLCCAAGAQTVTGSPVDVLTNAQQVLNLGIEKARTSPCRVALTGVVTFPVPGRSWAFVQDETAGILVIYTNAQINLSAGERITV